MKISKWVCVLLSACMVFCSVFGLPTVAFAEEPAVVEDTETSVETEDLFEFTEEVSLDDTVMEVEVEDVIEVQEDEAGDGEGLIESQTGVITGTPSGTEVTTLSDLTTYAGTGGEVYLGADISGAELSVNTAAFTLDLNGHTLTGTDAAPVISVDYGIEFTLLDSSGGSGSITQPSGNTKKGISNSGIFTMKSGTISGCNDGGVYNSGTFTLEGGTITDCKAYQGGGICSSYGTLIIKGGTINGCSATYQGGGIYYNTMSDTVTLEGGTITNCNAPTGGGIAGYGMSGFRVEVSGNPNVTGNFKTGTTEQNNVYGPYIILNGNFTGSVGITLSYTPSVGDIFGARNGGYSGAEKFFYDDGMFVGTVSESDTNALAWRLAGSEITTVEELNTAASTGGKWFLGADITGAAATLAADMELNLNGYGITGNGTDPVISIPAGKDLTLKGTGTITQTSGSGKGIDIENGTFTMLGGTITGCEYGVYSEYGTVTINGGTISSCTNGGISSIAGTLTMTSGTIKGCSSFSGGGVYSVNGTFTMAGGLITDCSATGLGGGVCINQGTFIMSGGTITGCSADDGGGCSGNYPITPPEIKVSGDAVIAGNTFLGSSNNLSISRINLILDDDFTGSIGVSGGNPGTNPVFGTITGSATGAENFFYDDGTYIGSVSTTDPSKLEWAGLSGAIMNISQLKAAAVVGGTWEIGADISAVAVTITAANLILDLAGYTLTGNSAERVFKVPNGSSFTLKDSSAAGTGTITQSGTGGGGIFNEGTLALESGTITGCSVNEDYNSDKERFNGGGVFNAGSFTMSGGKITDCHGSSTGYGNGGGIYNEGTVVMEGGEIASCSGYIGGGGVNNTGLFTMTGGSINSCYSNMGTGGSGVFNSGELRVAGNADITGNTVSSYNPALSDLSSLPEGFKLIGDFTGSIGFYYYDYQAPTPGIQLGIMEGGNFAGAENLFCDDASLGLVGMVSPFDPTKILWTRNSKTIYTNADLITAAGTGGDWYLGADVPNAVATVTVPDLVLDLNAHILTGTGSAPVITVSAGAGFTLKDSSTESVYEIDHGAFTQASGGNASGVKNEGTFVLESGVITGCNATNGGGVNNAGGTFTITGGSIENCRATDGGGVYNAGGTVNMSGGSIVECTASGSGGGVYSGNINMTGGTITDCEAGNGGGCYGSGLSVSGSASIGGNFNTSTAEPDNAYMVSLVMAGDFTGSIGIRQMPSPSIGTEFGTVTGSSIGAEGFSSDNGLFVGSVSTTDPSKLVWSSLSRIIMTVSDMDTASRVGGDWILGADLDVAATVTSPDFILDFNGHTLTNTTLSRVISIAENASFTMKDSSADGTGGIVNSSGGGVLNGGTFTLISGRIANCGGMEGCAVRNNSGDTKFYMKGGTLDNCGPTISGGAVYGGQLIMSGGTMTGCSAGQGGAVAWCKVFMTGGSITNCTASNGGGLYGVVAKISGTAMITGNTNNASAPSNLSLENDSDNFVTLAGDFTGSVGITQSPVPSLGTKFGVVSGNYTGVEGFFYDDASLALEGSVSATDPTQLVWGTPLTQTDLTLDEANSVVSLESVQGGNIIIKLVLTESAGAQPPVAGSNVTLYNGNAVIGTPAVTDAQGAVIFTIPQSEFAAGATELTAKSEKTAVYWGSSKTVTVTISTTVADVISTINDIGEVEYTDESKAKIDAARTAYDGLTDDQKGHVTAEQLKVLTDAEARYEELRQKYLNDKAAADEVTALINQIGEVEYTEESKAKIDAAREAYNALTEDQKALVTNYGTLLAAERRYRQLCPYEEENDHEGTYDAGITGAVTGTWEYHGDTNTWSFIFQDGRRAVSTWVKALNPYAKAWQPKASWFYFNEKGEMLTGWQWIKDRDGVIRCYYLNPVSNGILGACYLDGRTADGYFVNKDGAWIVGITVQTKKI